jgi:signal transduction histidine kinase
MQLQDEIEEIIQYVDAGEMIQPGSGRCSVAEIQAAITDVGARLGIRLGAVACGVENPAATYAPIARQTLELIVWELFENAKKFHPEHAPTVDIRIAGAPAGVQIQVCDDGRTLTPGQLSRIWIPYYQAERRHTGQVPGMGLGLSIVASLIWELNGTCRAYNRDDGSGLGLEITLPVVNEESKTERFGRVEEVAS